MMKSVLQELDRLQADLAAIDPARDLQAADCVADIAKRLRETLGRARDDDGHLSSRLMRLRRLDTVAIRAA